jgi:hypothetical protein
MKIIPFFFLIFLGTSCLNQSKESNRQLLKLNVDEIEDAEIKKEFYDTIGVKLSHHQLEKLAEWINTTKNAQMIKAKPEYWILVKMKDDTHLYKVFDDKLGELDLYIELDQPDYFQNCFRKGKKRESEIHVRMGC